MTWSERGAAIKVGDNVAYSAAYLKSTGQQTGDVPFARGVVTALVPLGPLMLAEIDWQGSDLPVRVNVVNLTRVGSRGFAME